MSSGINLDGPRVLVTITEMTPTENKPKGEHVSVTFECAHMGQALKAIEESWISFTVFLCISIVPLPREASDGDT